MIRYSNDINVYACSRKGLLTERAELTVVDAIKIYNQNNAMLDDSVKAQKNEITERSISDGYDEAIRLFSEELLRIYGMLGAKGGLTQNEWEHIKCSIVKNVYIFPDIFMQLGSKIWYLKKDDIEEFLKQVLKKHGIVLKIVPESSGSLLYEKESDFIEQMTKDFSINNIFDKIESDLDRADYVGTKKRIRYITIYDFVKYHLGLEKIPSKEEFSALLGSCIGNDYNSIRNARTTVDAYKGDFWGDYEKFHDFKMIKALALWYGKSTVRTISREVYDELAANIDESMLKKAMAYLKVHTAYLDPRRMKGDTKGTSALFTFRLEGANGSIFATVGENSYIDDYRNAVNRIAVTSMSSLTVENLDFGKNYCVSLWEDMGGGDVVKLGDLPRVTPGIKWPILKNLSKSPFADNMKFTLQLEGGEGALSYVGCMKKGGGKISSPSEGEQFKPDVNGNELLFEISSLEFDTEYTFCVFVLLDGGKYTSKLAADFSYIPQKAHVERLIRLSAENNKYSFDKEVFLDFQCRGWPMLFGNCAVEFACRSDRFPTAPNDGENGFYMNNLTSESYKNSIFKIITPNDEVYPVLYVCGWLKTPSGESQIVVRSMLYHLYFRFKGNECSIEIPSQVNSSDIVIPILRVTCFDKNENVVFSSNSVKPDSKGKFAVSPSGKIKYVVVEAADPAERQVYQFRNRVGSKLGKSKISIF